METQSTITVRTMKKGIRKPTTIKILLYTSNFNYNSTPTISTPIPNPISTSTLNPSATTTTTSFTCNETTRKEGK
jgi:hypothetical protein